LIVAKLCARCPPVLRVEYWKAFDHSEKDEWHRTEMVEEQ
jgi:hypothetical protein